MGGYTVLGGEYEISGKTRNQPKQFLSLRCKSYRKTNDQHCTSSIRVLIEEVYKTGRRVLNNQFIKSTKENYQHSKGCPYWSTNKDLAARIKAFDKLAFQKARGLIGVPSSERSAKTGGEQQTEDSSKQHVTMSVNFLEFKELVRVELELKQREINLKQKELDLVRREADFKIEKLENELNFYRSIVQKSPDAPLSDPNFFLGPQTAQSSEDFLDNANSFLNNYHLLSQLLAQLNSSDSTEN